jgi:hypothetical protein
MYSGLYPALVDSVKYQKIAILQIEQFLPGGPV